MEEILQQIDRLLEENKGAQAQALMEEGLEQALMSGDRGSAVTLLNELIGFCRETGQAEKSYYYGEAVLNLLQEMGLSGTLPFATSVLNIASAYRAGGRLEDAMTCYRAVEQIYSQVLEPGDMLVASLYNNKALLYQEMGEFEAAGAYLERALEIARENGCTVAVLKARSPSCGCGEIYDGTFTHTPTSGWGLAARMLEEAGLEVMDEEHLQAWLYD